MTEPEIDPSKISDEMAREILNQGEVHLNALLSASVSVDQKSVALAGIFAIILTAIIGGVVALFANNNSDFPILLSASVTATMLFIGVVLSVTAGWPSKFHIAGNEPKNWLTPQVAYNPLTEAIVGEAQNYQEKIEFNKGMLRKQATLVGLGALFGFLAPFVGVIIWIFLTVLGASEPAVVEVEVPSQSAPIVQDARQLAEPSAADQVKSPSNQGVVDRESQ